MAVVGGHAVLASCTGAKTTEKVMLRLGELSPTAALRGRWLGRDVSTVNWEVTRRERARDSALCWYCHEDNRKKMSFCSPQRKKIRHVVTHAACFPEIVCRYCFISLKGLENL